MISLNGTKMRTIAIANQKGGCGKTTTAVNLAAALAQAGRRVLIIDLDPQGHTTLAMGHNPDTMAKTIYNVIVGTQISIGEVIIQTSIENLHLAPANILLAGAEIELAGMLGRELVLNEQRQQVVTFFPAYDLVRRDPVVTIVCSPRDGMLFPGLERVLHLKIKCVIYDGSFFSVAADNIEIEDIVKCLELPIAKVIVQFGVAEGPVPIEAGGAS